MWFVKRLCTRQPGLTVDLRLHQTLWSCSQNINGYVAKWRRGYGRVELGFGPAYETCLIKLFQIMGNIEVAQTQAYWMWALGHRYGWLPLYRFETTLLQRRESLWSLWRWCGKVDSSYLDERLQRTRNSVRSFLLTAWSCFERASSPLIVTHHMSHMEFGIEDQ